MLDIDTTWNVRPALKADASGFHGLPDVNEGVSEDENRAQPPARDGLGDTRFLRPRNHVVNEDARARCVRRPKTSRTASRLSTPSRSTTARTATDAYT